MGAAVLLLQAASWCISLTDAALPVVTEVVSGSIFRKSSYVTVDQYTLSIAASSAIVEINLLSMETANNVTFSDVNSDCDSAYIDPHIFLFKQLNDGSLTFVASNDDAGDDNAAYYSRGFADGSVSAEDSYLIQQLSAGTYVLAVGRYPLTQAAAAAGKSTDSVNDFTPYTCMARKASYGNYKITMRTQSSSTSNVITKTANSYVGNSCNVASYITNECVYALPADIGSVILKTCSYDKTIY
ncbi:Serine protease V8 [Phytophthora cinnamomi]|uniref:Serine protease V8 n=1 Tax=Phytophthora cinnamomi TaxID=4785 RepID=UPI003559C1B1|nr:Serine protease V8 [Phytophthora cinnamomi]